MTYYISFILNISKEKSKLADERYDTFKWILVHLIRANIESIKYEDLLRSIFGKEAFALVYVDKIVNSVFDESC